MKRKRFMPKSCTLLQQILINPGDYFEYPEDIMSRDDFTHAEKLTILKIWADDLMLLEIATSENMGGPDPTLLQRVLMCIENLHLEKGTESHMSKK